MREGSYGDERFDLRLTVLRLLRELDKILLAAFAGMLLFGGVYSIKNVILPGKQYTATITCKIEYTDPPTKSGDYYINTMTWNTYVDSGEFLDLVKASAPFQAAGSAIDTEGLRRAVSADVASDIQVPSFTITYDIEKDAEMLKEAVAETVTGPWAQRLPEVVSIEVIDDSGVHLLVDEYVRPVRAFVLGALLGCFLAVVLLLLREIGADSIWLPSTLRTRYGLTALGTPESVEFVENMRYVLSEKQGELRKIALCTSDENVDPGEVLKCLREKSLIGDDREWLPVPAFTLSPESVRCLREADGVMLAVPAGLHTGKPLEHTLEFLAEQDVKITAALLWGADEKLIRRYYFFSDKRNVSGEKNVSAGEELSGGKNVPGGNSAPRRKEE